ncbi:Sugar kinase of the NBD/HSP70 family, may contain an N-terminal HTH domain [Actinacidiphila yanglinensis]|uniref:Sugar kinase of the NBD/HSP70 family, may contain an N-terminal HTH domain n=1 Tax=Actinacidiphila yanglinensis TaxID=310779 RepID=A0A1H6DQY2_9ACTN|nr:ROK family protein [Actinacidiphila yanglinensis]SEG87005.1 Sugar kinase of the NBD/HSP70 family, may contain an N-terminal HTH domain [Actinacidiphila yanglinensis]
MAQTAAPRSTAGHLLELIRTGQAGTRGELQTLTGLSRSTVGHRLDQLFAAGWIASTPGQLSTGGRPSVQLTFDPGHAVVLAADLDTTHGHAAVLDLAGSVLAERRGELRVADGPEKVLDTLADWFAALLGESGDAPSRVCGVGLSVPGPVEFDTGLVIRPPIMPGWDGYPIRDRMRAALSRQTGTDPLLPVLIDNDANQMALGEQRGGWPDCSTFMLVKVSTGIGAGVVIDGQVFRGIDGGAGDLGHIRLHDQPHARCMCGSYGCLAAVASGRAVAGQLAELGVPAESGVDVRALLDAGQPDAVRLAREAGHRCGEVLATAVTLLNPGVLMIAGDLAETHFLTGVRELLYQRALPRSTRSLQIVTSRLGDRAALAGATATVVEYLYAPEQADLRLEALAGRATATA